MDFWKCYEKAMGLYKSDCVKTLEGSENLYFVGEM